jgi:hypothetical protein
MNSGLFWSFLQLYAALRFHYCIAFVPGYESSVSGMVDILYFYLHNTVLTFLHNCNVWIPNTLMPTCNISMLQYL